MLVLLWIIIVWSFISSSALLMTIRVFPPWSDRAIYSPSFIRPIPFSHCKKPIYLWWRLPSLLHLILPPNNVFLTTHHRAPTTTMETAPILTTLRIRVVIIVTMDILIVATHKVLLLGKNIRIPLTIIKFGLRHHWSCLCVCILLFRELTVLLLPINMEFWASVLRLTLPQLHQHPLTSQLLCTPCLSLLWTTRLR